MKNIRLTWLALFFSIFLFLFYAPSKAQINVFQDMTAQQYVQNVLLGQGVQVISVNYIGKPEQIGRYTVGAGGPQELFTQGLVLSTGDVNDAPGPNGGPNDASSSVGGQYTFGGNDPSGLTKIVQSTVYDAVVLEIEFKTVANNVEFRYVFASDEYPEFVDAGYNDVFAFFISGPGYPPQGTNIALIPGTNIPVAIDNVNDNSYSNYYVDNWNDINYNTRFDGFTKQLTAKAQIFQPCETYKLKIAIADVGDHVYDSAVFLEAKSLVSAGYSGEATASSVYEGTSDSLCFKFYRYGDLSANESWPVIIGGDATYGVDYILSKTTIDFPPGVGVDSVCVTTFFDCLDEEETIIVKMKPELACDTISLSAELMDTLAYDGQITAGFAGNNPVVTFESCDGDVCFIYYRNGNLDQNESWPLVISGTATYGVDYVLSKNTVDFPIGATTDTVCMNAFIDGIIDSYESVIVKVKPEDACDTIALTSYIVDVDTVLFLTNDTTICGNINGEQFTFTALINNGVGDISYTWRNLQGEILGNASFLQLMITQDTAVTVTVVDNGCGIPTVTDTVNLTFLGQDGPIEIHLPDSLQVCKGQSVLLDPAVTGGTGSYNYQWLYNGSSGSTLTFTPLQTTEITLLVDDGCGLLDKTVVVYFFPDPKVTISDTTICSNGQVKLIPLLEYGSGAFNTPVWKTLDGQTLTTAPFFSFSPATDIDVVVEVTDTCGQVARDTAKVNLFAELSLDDMENTAICEGDSTLLVAVAQGAGQIKYIWKDGDGNVVGNELSIKVGPTTTTIYTVAVTDTCKTLTQNVTVNVTPKNLAITSISASPVPVCKGGEVTMTAEAEGGTGVYQFDWSNGMAGAQIILNLEDTTTFILTVSDGCSTVDTTIEVPIYPPLLLNAVPDTILCAGESVSFKMTPSGGNGNYVEFTWTNAGGDIVGNDLIYSIVPPVGVHDFVALVKDGCGFLASDPTSVTVKPRPVINAGTSVEICEGDSLFLNGSVDLSQGCTYQWGPVQGLSDPHILTPMVKPSVTTIYTLSATCDGCEGLSDVVTITVRPRPKAIIAVADLYFCAQSGGVMIPGAGTGGTPPLTYQWTPTVGLSDATIPTPVANPPQDTTYKLVVTDALGCVSDTASVHIDILAIPKADAGPDIELCADEAGDTLRGGAVGGLVDSYEYHWSPATGLNATDVRNPFARPTVTTTYTLKVISKPDNCASVNVDDLSIVTVFVNPRPQVNAGQNVTLCIGESVQIGNFASGAGPGYTYVWTPSIGLSDTSVAQPTAQPNQTVTYFVVVKSNGCVSAASPVTITVNPAPTVAVEEVADICPGQSVQLHSSVTGGLPGAAYTYSWQPVEGLNDPAVPNPIASPIETTVYTLYVETNTCLTQKTDTAHVTVFPPLDVVANPSAAEIIIYEGDSTVLPAILVGDPGYQIEWKPAESLSATNVLQPTANPKQTTLYTVTVTRTECSDTDTVRVIVVPKFMPTISGSRARICKGETVYLQAFGLPENATFVWTPALDLADATQLQTAATPRQTTNYTITMTDRGFSETANFFVEVLPQPEAAFSHSYPEGCRSLTVSFKDESKDAFQWQWNLGDGTPTLNEQNPRHNYPLTGEYLVKLRVTGFGGCWDTTSAIVSQKVFPLLTPNFTSEPPIASQMTLHNHNAMLGAGRLEPVVRFTQQTLGAVAQQWDFGDGQSSTDPFPLHRYERAGMFDVTLTVVDSQGCVYSVRKGPYVVLEPEVVIPNVFTPDGDGINDRWHVLYNGLAAVRIALFDRWGNLMYESNNKEEGWNGTNKDGSAAPVGVYYYMVYIGDKPYDGSITLLR